MHRPAAAAAAVLLCSSAGLAEARWTGDATRHLHRFYDSDAHNGQQSPLGFDQGPSWQQGGNTGFASTADFSRQQPAPPPPPQAPQQAQAAMATRPTTAWVLQNYNSVALVFMVLVFRSMHYVELASQNIRVRSTQAAAPFLGGGPEPLLIRGLVGLDVLGFVLAITRRKELKGQMKAILSLNMAYQLFDFGRSVCVLVFQATTYLSRDEHMAGMLWNAFFMLFTATCRKANWT